MNEYAKWIASLPKWLQGPIFALTVGAIGLLAVIVTDAIATLCRRKP